MRGKAERRGQSRQAPGGGKGVRGDVSARRAASQRGRHWSVPRHGAARRGRAPAVGGTSRRRAARTRRRRCARRSRRALQCRVPPTLAPAPPTSPAVDAARGGKRRRRDHPRQGGAPVDGGGGAASDRRGSSPQLGGGWRAAPPPPRSGPLLADESVAGVAPGESGPFSATGSAFLTGGVGVAVFVYQTLLKYAVVVSDHSFAMPSLLESSKFLAHRFHLVQMRMYLG